MLERLRAEVALLGEDDARAAQGLLDQLAAERAAGVRPVVEALESERYTALLDRLEAAVAPPLSGGTTTLAKIWQREVEANATHVRRRSATSRRTMRCTRRGSPSSVPATRAELAAHELGRPGAAFVARAKELQDVLGDHQDAVVAEERIRAWSATAPAAGRLAAGRLVQLERGRHAASRAAWPAAWARLDRAARKAAS